MCIKNQITRCHWSIGSFDIQTIVYVFKVSFHPKTFCNILNDDKILAKKIWLLQKIFFLSLSRKKLFVGVYKVWLELMNHWGLGHDWGRDYTRLKRLPSDKHSSLFGAFVRYEKMNCCEYSPRVRIHKTSFSL